jgi:hypothetical protein
MLVKCLLHNIVYYIMNQWLGIMALHLIPSFYKLYTTTLYNKPNKFKLISSHKNALRFTLIPNKFQMYKIKEYQIYQRTK